MKPLPPDVELIVAVCDAAGWLARVAGYYHSLGLDPLYVVDGRSADGSLDVLRRRRARVRVHSGSFPRVESLMAGLIPTIDREWVLRMDDDEVPSRGLLAWLHANVARRDFDVAALPRLWLRRRADGRLLGTRCTLAGREWGPDRQHRLFRPRAVAPYEAIHTPGFDPVNAIDAPGGAAFYHLDWLVRGREARAAKIARYEAQQPGMGHRFAEYYLPEDRPACFYDFAPVGGADAGALEKVAG